jgi:2-polyprenyl-3-methyl-5-hydroxy-6-metoxy-1,4-benzoquinol methylase
MNLTLPLLFLAQLSLATTPDAGAAPDELAQLTRQWFAAYDARDVAQMSALESPQFEMQNTAVHGDAARVHDIARSSTLVIEGREYSRESTRLTNEAGLYRADLKVTQHNVLQTKVTLVQTATAVWSKTPVGWKLFHLDLVPGGEEATREYWNERYRAQTSYDVKPNKLLLSAAGLHAPGRALDVGMGDGRNALALAERGWDVTGVDLAEAGVARAVQAAREKGLKVAGVIQDIDAFDFGTNRWDLIAFIYVGGSDAVAKVKAGLKPGGLVVVEWFRGEHGPPTDWKQLYAGWKVLRYEEVDDVADWGLTRQPLVRFIAQKP